jgi:hypothetical protein
VVSFVHLRPADRFDRTTTDGRNDFAMKGLGILFGGLFLAAANLHAAVDAQLFMTADPAVSIRKYTNGDDAQTPPGPNVPVGSTVTWTYVVKNRLSQGTLFGITVKDSQGAAVSCPATTLGARATMVCEALGTAKAGPYMNVGSVDAQFRVIGSGKGVFIRKAHDRDVSHYFGGPMPSPSPTPSPSPSPGKQGCTPGYWKNHVASWQGFTPVQTVVSVFTQSAAYPAIAGATLLQALQFPGGPGVEGGARNLLRAAVAALLNSASSGVDYPRTTAQVITQVNVALASGDRAAMLALAAALDADNNRGCPLN